ncbi:MULTISPECIES: hypothetical protein [Acinetobacter]|uniref:Uncharacterized protein n=1 Tax=Acinetobacter ursingii TaxID=108980 RepID=A0A7T9Z6E3_9GAMM|nr:MULTISPECIES: hypothetical protein [Acinetobacter]ENX48775.1 hypothetical protein F943_02312 [Acinetobacter ursingii NIPH 706]EXD37916.1 membrane domain protein [Acinetobacter sp. 479375]MCH2014688.1 hypothetical protein [Acinetobacter ursingii]MCU4522557.1 hypothetical protein [Acinetobacter ursingii]MCU4587422.1 hypothetical protein [Acinetobacter ursingii]
MKKIKEILSLIIVPVITIAYLLFIFKITELNAFMKLELNAKGDFLAGIFAPLAFLWLVYGYYQQGQELKQNTEALRLQAEELKNSVEQQIQQFDLSSQQFAIFKEKEELEIARINNDALPIFHIWIRSHNTHSGYNIGILNTGAKAKNVLLRYIKSDDQEFNFEYSVFNQDQTEAFIMRQIEISKTDANFFITFTDGLGRIQVSKFMIINSSNNIHKIAFIKID